jgi:proteasome accessory factor A
MSEYAMWLKIATTCITLDLLDAKVLPNLVRLEDPLGALKSVSRDASYRWIVKRGDGKTMSAIDLQRVYLGAAQQFLKGKDAQTDEVLAHWEEVLDLLESDPMKLSDRLDWVAKKQMLEEYMASENVAWGDDVLHSLDLEYHNVNHRTGLYYGLEEIGAMRRVCSDAQLQSALNIPPQNTRAKGRAAVIKELLERKWSRYLIDWDWVRIDKDRHLELRNPFHTYEDEAELFMQGLT